MTITSGPNLGVMEDGAAGDVHVTEFKLFLRAMDLLTQCNVNSATTTAQPGSPANGDAYIVPTGATGAVFSANIGKLVRWTTKTSPAQWDVFTPKEGWQVRARDTDVRYEHNGTTFVIVPTSRDIVGLALVYVGVNAITVTSGEAYIQSTGTRLLATSDIPKTGISLGNDVWGHVYVYSNSGVADVEIVTTAPASPFFGTARSKTGDTSRRYVGSVRTNSSGQIYKFMMVGERVNYLLDVTASPFRVLTNGTSTSWASFSFANVVPVTSNQSYAILQNIDTTVSFNVSSGASGTDFSYVVNPKQVIPVELPLGAAQTFNYQALGSTATGLYVDVLSYVFER